MLLKGFGFSGYRNFGDNLVKISPLKKINMIIGQNNVGKSNIINFLSSQYPHFVSKAKDEKTYVQEQKSSFNDIDHPISNIKTSYRISFPIFKDEVDDYIEKKISGKSAQFANSEHLNRDYLKKILTSNYFSDEGVHLNKRHQSPIGFFSTP